MSSLSWTHRPDQEDDSRPNSDTAESQRRGLGAAHELTVGLRQLRPEAAVRSFRGLGSPPNVSHVVEVFLLQALTVC
jgi:hypothetical protein